MNNSINKQSMASPAVVPNPQPSATPTADLGNLRGVPYDVMTMVVLPEVAARGGLRAFSQVNYMARRLALNYCSHTTNCLHTATLNAVMRRRGVAPALGEHDARQLAACNELMAMMLGTPHRLTGENLIAWQEDEQQYTSAACVYEASQKILHAARTDANRLELCEAELTSLPEKIGRLTSVRDLDLFMNRFADLETIAPMTQLEKLCMRSNYDMEDIDGVEQLVNLQNLCLMRTKVESVELLRGHPTLRVLNIDETRVKDLKPLIGIGTLQTLTIGFNTWIPEGLRRDGLTITRGEQVTDIEDESDDD